MKSCRGVHVTGGFCHVVAIASGEGEGLSVFGKINLRNVDGLTVGREDGYKGEIERAVRVSCLNCVSSGARE